MNLELSILSFRVDGISLAHMVQRGIRAVNSAYCLKSSNEQQLQVPDRNEKINHQCKFIHVNGQGNIFPYLGGMLFLAR